MFTSVYEGLLSSIRASQANSIILYRTIGKTSSETRLYFVAPDLFHSEASSLQEAECKSSLNVRASYLSGQDIYGGAILAAIGYPWKSKELSFEDISMQSYYRL